MALPVTQGVAGSSPVRTATLSCEKAMHLHRFFYITSTVTGISASSPIEYDC